MHVFSVGKENLGTLWSFSVWPGLKSPMREGRWRTEPVEPPTSQLTLAGPSHAIWPCPMLFLNEVIAKDLL